MTNKMTRERVEEMVAAARAKGERPHLSCLNLSGLNLSGLDLSHADLSDADMRGTILVDTNLRYAYLAYANLRYAVLSRSNMIGANLRGADLSDANLHCANLTGAILADADLRLAFLYGAILTAVVLRGADMRDVKVRGLFLDGLPSGDLAFLPTPCGWCLTIGCWKGTTDELREMIAGNDWPEAEGEQITERRPMLEAAAAMCDAYAAANHEALAEVKATAARWKEGDQ